MVNVMDFGATGDGVTDDRLAIQAALTVGAGGEVDFPIGSYAVSVGGLGWDLNVPAGTLLRGESRTGSVLMQRGGQPSSTRLLYLGGAGITLQNLTLDGNKANQTTDEHRSGVFAIGASGLVLRGVTARNFTGDGFYFSFASNGIMLDDLLGENNERNGITFGGGTSGAILSRSQFRGNKVQAFDSEPGSGYTVDGVSIIGCTLDVGVGNGSAISAAGSGAGWRSKGWLIANNVITGAVQIAWATDVVFVGNTVRNPTNHSGVSVYRSCDHILIANNDIALTGVSIQVISVLGTGTGQVPDHVQIIDNLLSTGMSHSHGIVVSNSRNTEISRNVMTGAGAVTAGVAGIYARPTITTEGMQTLIVRGNTVSNFGQYGLAIAGLTGTSAKISKLEIVGNTWGDTVGTQLAALRLDDGSGAARDVRVSENVLSGGCVTEIARAPAGASVPTVGQRWLVP